MSEHTSPLADDAGIDRKQLKLIAQRFQDVNQARLERARSALAPRHQPLLGLIPLLLHANHPVLPGYVSAHAPCGLRDYEPAREVLAQAQRLGRSFEYRRDPHQRRQLLSLFLMGSLGTVAQSEGSDLDIWVCYPDSLAAGEVQELRRKCDLIEAWAGGQGLELHFFLMSPERFRRGERESLSTEDCGSTQHVLLLDEFYRTAILLAGLPPLWWLVPPEQAQQHAQWCARLLERRFVPADAYVDFGGVGQIPAEEFLGAGIWQLYKAIESPYKSALKLLLVESYADQFPATAALSDDFKRAVYAGEHDIDALDPYVLIYQRLEQYLHGRGEAERLELARRCFYFKVGKALSRPPRGGVKSWQRQLLERLVAGWGWSREQLALLDARPGWKAARVMAEQRVLVAEVVGAFRFLTDFARRLGVEARVDARELSVLGRKLFCAFERKAGKVEFINPGIAQQLGEDTLHLAPCAAAEGEAERQWGVFTEIERRRQPLKRSRSLLEVLVWCHANGLLQPRTRLLSAGPVEEAELAQMARAIAQWLPTDIGERLRHGVPAEDYLQPERTLHWTLVVNVAADPMQEMKRQGLHRLSSATDALGYSGLKESLVLNLELLARTSWGELLCRRYEGPQALQHCINDFLRARPASLSVHSFSASRAQLVAERVQQLLQSLGQACGGRARFRYVIGINGRLWLLQADGGELRWRPVGDDAELLHLLAEPQAAPSPVLLDLHALPYTALACALSRAEPGAVSVFYHEQGEQAALWVVDEMGSVIHWNTPFRDEATLLRPLDRFLRATRLRRELAGEPAADTHYFQLQRRGREWQASTRPLVPAEGPYHALTAQVERDADGNRFSLWSGRQEFNSYELGAALYREVARAILQRRREPLRYPCYITDLELSHGVEGCAPTVRYLHYKRALEEALNRAMAELDPG